MRPSKHSRGSVLFTVLIVVLAITLLGTALMVGSGRHLSGARLHEHNVGLSNCAMAVRQYIAANVSGGPGLSTLNFTVPTTGATINLTGGHYEKTDGGYTLAATPSFGVKGGSSVQNIANAMPLSIGSGATQRSGSAVCTDPDGRTYEVEFSWIQ